MRDEKQMECPTCGENITLCPICKQGALVRRVDMNKSLLYCTNKECVFCKSIGVQESSIVTANRMLENEKDIEDLYTQIEDSKKDEI